MSTATASNTYKIPAEQAKVTGVESLVVAPGRGTFLGNGTSELGSFEITGIVDGATGTITLKSGRAVNFDIHFSMVKEKYRAEGHLAGQSFHLDTDKDGRIIDRSAPISIDPALKPLFTAMAAVREANPPTVPIEKPSGSVGIPVIHERAVAGNRGDTGIVASPEVSGECCLAIVLCVAAIAVSAGAAAGAGIAAGYACRHLIANA